MNIKIIEIGTYLPKKMVTNEEIESKLGLERGYIEKRTGIQERYYAEGEEIIDLAKKSVEDLNKKVLSKGVERGLSDVELIVVATTTSRFLMPAISNEVQKALGLKMAISFDVLAGCSGFINALDLALMYMNEGRVKKALVIGVDKLSEYTDKDDVGTSIILSDGAGAILLEAQKHGENEQKNSNKMKKLETVTSDAPQIKKYYCNIASEIDTKNILVCRQENKIKMNGKEVYKYAVTTTVENVNELLKKANTKIDQIKYIVPHQSNMKIMKSIASRLKVDFDKLIVNIDKVGNTFCASIPIAMAKMLERHDLQEGDKVILLGYGGGLNTGSIMLQF